MDNVLIFATVLSPILTALMSLLKVAFPMPKNIVPLVALALGIALGAAAYPFTELALDLRLWAGGFAGLASVGVFELTNKRAGMTN